MTAFPTFLRVLNAVAILGGLAGCTTGPVPPANPEGTAALALEQARVPPPPGVNPESCWVRDVAPAQVQTVTRHVEISPAQYGPDGKLLQPARYRTETEHAITAEREALVFETPCPEVVTPEFIATLQRALAARGVYRGAITGQMDTATIRAVRRYQSRRGLPSGLLSIQSARSLGLVTIPRGQL